MVEHLEAVNHTSLLKDIFTGKIDLPVNENIIKQMHKSLMQGIREDAGKYSMHQRAIRGVDLILPHPDDIEEEMSMFFTKANYFKEHPIKHIAKMHADFELIHPFGDGNGRIGRLIMIIQLIEKGYCPCMIPVSQKSEYYEYLEYAQKKSDTHFIYFLSESILNGYKIIKKQYA
ncbi:MAG: Fic family protein [Candidatus Omnitrophica bacterium]|nr:Fic family protein [Candidatus Omnitrophota bacterium]MBU0878946.1 Fic family protein [Candidatus Omnitrophota bacterium]MBU0896725.1 Fic family protein [Candidatus Omnitrophota bacterium]MBU1133956.1 Fic family protein [Candidatus Omnitrophota bacterium]MBU1367855.1 Fic family protein [Candidatus Omnitrophota bacterium]